MLEELSKALSAHLGVPIFIGARPSKTDNCITFVMNDGANSALYFGQTEQLGYPLVVMYVRNTSYVAAYDQAIAIKEFMKTYKSESVFGSIPVGNLSSLGKDELGRSEILVSFRFITEE